jgi:glycosyltransferase involved in cell wall biosynthesis
MTISHCDAMRIPFLTEKFPPAQGGLAISSQRLVNLLSSSGIQVDVFTLTNQLPAGEISRCNLENNIRVFSLGPSKHIEDTFSNWFDLLSYEHRQKAYHLLHAYFIPQAGFMAVYFARTFGLPSVISARGNDLDRAIYDPARASHILYALQNASVVTTNARDLQQKARALAPQQRVILIPNSVDCELFRPVPRDPFLTAHLGLEGRYVIGFCGEARAKKGLNSLLLAFRQFAAQRPAALLLVGGIRPGPDQETLTIFERQNPTLKIVVCPHLPPAELSQYYAQMDILALPSLRDGLPNALLEGLACGCVIVGSQAGGIPDAIQHGQNGWLVPPGDPLALAEAFGNLSNDLATSQRLSIAARQSAQSHFFASRELTLNLQIYQGLVDPAINLAKI